MNICDYGCGKEALHSLKNGKWCCSDTFQKCEFVRNKISEKIKIVAKTNETYKKGQSESRKVNVDHYKNNHFLLYKTINMRNHLNKKEVEVQCENKNCTKWFTPTISKLYERSRCINIGNINAGLLYCSNICKQHLRLEKMKQNHPIFFEKENIKVSDDRKFLCNCKNPKCEHSKENNGWFEVSNGNLNSRMNAITKNSCNSYLFCSNECKNQYDIILFKNRYPKFCSLEDISLSKDNKIQLRCSNPTCDNSKENNGWFIPTKKSEYIKRIKAYEKTEKELYRRHYCSSECREYEKILKIKDKFPVFFKEEELKIDSKGTIYARCKNHNCLNSKENNGWFIPTSKQLTERKRELDHKRGIGGSYLYCSDECKETCSLFNKSVPQLIKKDKIAAGLLEDPWYTSVEYSQWRDQVFILDNGKCVWCDNQAEHAHHILPQKTHPELSLDPENGVSCCRECHFKYGHRDRWCTTGYLSTLVCDRIIRIQSKIQVVA